MNTRRKFLKSSSLFIGAAAAVGGRATLSASLTNKSRSTWGAEILETRVISQQPEFYCGWPTVARRRSGQLVLVYSGGRESHVCPFGRVELMRSDDEGKTWSWPQIIMDGPIDDRDAGIVEASDGSLLVTSFTSLAYEPTLRRAIQNGQIENGRFAKWMAAHKRADDAGRQQALGVWLTRSDDDGRTWSKRLDSLVNSPHGPISLNDGRLLYAGKDLWRSGQRVGVAESSDQGRSWKWLATIPTREGDDHVDYHELHIAEAKSGRLIAQIRNHNERNRGETLQSVSDDGGVSWSEPKSIGVWGLPSHLLRLADDRLLMTYGYRREPFGNQARLSEDEGETWSEPLTLSADGMGHDLGYPSTIQLSDGRLLSVWYERMKDSSQAVLRQAIWKVSS